MLSFIMLNAVVPSDTAASQSVKTTYLISIMSSDIFQQLTTSFKPNLTFLNKTGACLSGAPKSGCLLALLERLCLAKKGLAESNLATTAAASNEENKFYNIETPGPNVIKLSLSVIYGFS